MKKNLLFLHLSILIYWIYTGYLQADPMFIAGLGVLLMSLVIRQPVARLPVHQSTSQLAHQSTAPAPIRFGLLALLCVLLAFAAPARTFHFLALVFSAFFVVEYYWGRINEAPAFTAFLLTSIVKTMSVVLGFPLRLQLSKNAADVLHFMGSNAFAEGNLIHFGGHDFLVDTACAGLQMVEVSFLFCFFLLGILERRSGRHLAWATLLAWVLATGVLILIFNQLRIILLVLFNIPPENPLHELLGLIGLIVYVFAPLWWGMKWSFKKGRPNSSPGDSSRAFQVNRWWQGPGFIRASQVSLMAFLLYFAFVEHRGEVQQNLIGQALIPAGLPIDCRKESLPEGIVKYSNDQLLVYVKPVRGWYGAEHTPLICWQGSGYEFGQMQVQKMGETTIYTGILKKKGGQEYHTAWWFDNGRERTISQARWRWLDAGGAPGFSLVNVTARDAAILEKQLYHMFALEDQHEQ